MVLFVIPLLSCGCSSVVGILIGQLGNFFLGFFGENTSLFAIPVFCGLFVLSFGLSFLFSALLRKWLLRAQKAVR